MKLSRDGEQHVVLVPVPDDSPGLPSSHVVNLKPSTYVELDSVKQAPKILLAVTVAACLGLEKILVRALISLPKCSVLHSLPTLQLPTHMCGRRRSLTHLRLHTSSRHSIAGFIEPCNFFLFADNNRTGRANAPDWICMVRHSLRTLRSVQAADLVQAYHDMVWTPQSASLKSRRAQMCSILPQNTGNGFANTISMLFGMSDRYISITDALALRAIIAIEGCGVQHEPFLDIVPELNNPNSSESVVHFDSTFVHFDNNICIAAHIICHNRVHFGHYTESADYSLTRLNSLHRDAWSCLHASSSMQLTEVIMLLPIKPSGLELILDSDMLKFSGEVQFWNMTEDMDCTVHLLWDDHVGGMNNVTLHAMGVSSATTGSYSVVWYMFNAMEDIPLLLLNATAGIMNMYFAVDNKLEDQGGVGFTVQDGVVFSEMLCLTSQDPIAGRLDVAVRNGVNPMCVYFEQESCDSVQCLIIVETEIVLPVQLVATNTAYSI
ncbi:hypothetical protein B0H10DRAFT_1950180 [Mycena sp. CBHHK59/15]|nr:hypothetical protein B0H10DRAFT_1950180 [Mycena sp. CBHHK59/15]